MPVNFLSKEQEEQYGCYCADPNEIQLAKYFHLDEFDLSLIQQCRGQHNQLGFAIQLTTVRFLGRFLPNPTDEKSE